MIGWLVIEWYLIYFNFTPLKDLTHLSDFDTICKSTIWKYIGRVNWVQTYLAIRYHILRAGLSSKIKWRPSWQMLVKEKQICFHGSINLNWRQKLFLFLLTHIFRWYTALPFELVSEWIYPGHILLHMIIDLVQEVISRIVQFNQCSTQLKLPPTSSRRTPIVPWKKIML